jgi:hypothetical protein
MNSQTVTIAAYPLQWPLGWKRTQRRKSAPYRIGFVAARDHLVHELQLLGARNVVISTNVPTRLDGLPLAAGRVQNGDPGVAVYWMQGNQARAMACDKWLRVESNIRAMGLSIAAMRALDRCGTSEILDRVFTGFAQLPAMASSDGSRPWRDVFGIAVDQPRDVQRQLVDKLYRELALKCHPDRGGSHEALVELNRARAEALRELGAA